MAEYVSVKQSNLLLIGDNISYEDGATIDPCANALHAMARAQFKQGESVCIYGAGPIGLFAVQYAKIQGASKIIAVDIWDQKLEQAKKVGADVMINAKDANVAQLVKEATGGLGTNVVIDFSGVPSAQKQCIHCASKLGRIVLLGISHKGLELSAEEVDLIMRKQLDVRGSWNSFTKPFPGSDWTDSVVLYDQHGMTAKDIISHRLTLDEAPCIFKRIKEGNFFFSKIMFYPQGLSEAN